ncbi:hypothetical protein V2J09_005768, partial [Rumex salicifolius]
FLSIKAEAGNTIDELGFFEGVLHQISWFQFLPLDPSATPSLDKSVRINDRDTSALQILSSHVQLQKEGFLSAWTNSFVGPWDPSQGSHNPDKKIKLWLFLPGRHASIIESAQLAVSRLRVVASGLWITPGDSEEIATALSQALKNKLERSLMVHSYVRFGDVFTRCSQSSRSEELFRKGQPAIEFVFAATEEGIFVHVIISAKLVRAVGSGDIQRLSKLSSNSSRGKLPLIVSPHGMRGRLTGCSPGDLVKQVYDGSDMFRSSSRLVGKGCQNCYAEVSLSCNIPESGAGMKLSLSSNKNFPNNQTCSPPIGGVYRRFGDETPVLEKTFIYPTEAILVPILQSSYARTSLKSIAGEMEAMHSSWMDSSDACGENSSSNSNNSSISSVSSGSSDSDHKMDTNTSDLEADADSLTCRQSGYGLKQGAKRSRPGTQDSFDQMGARINVCGQDAFKSDFNSSSIIGLGHDQMGSHWDWDGDNDKGMGMDIQALLSEFGDFGEFFENDVLPFGEPPGTAESEAMMFPVADSEDLGGTSAATVIDVSDPMLLPAAFPTFESFGQLPTVTEEFPNTAPEILRNASSAPLSSVPAVPSTEFDHVMKAEAFITFASEYGAVETPPSEVSSTLFRSPYRPKSRATETVGSSGNSSTYGATPPASPCFHVSNERYGKSVDSRPCAGKCDVGTGHKMKLYTHVHGGKDSADRKPVAYNDTGESCETGASSLYSGFGSACAKSVKKCSEVNFAADHLLLSPKTVTASELECLLFQASMCRIRHTLLSLSNSASDVLNWTAGSTLMSHVPSDPSGMTEDLSTKYEMKRKDSIPVRIAGDIDDGMLEGTLNAPVGVWRSVGSPKGSKPANTPPTEVFASCYNNSFAEGKVISYGQRQPLQDFLDGVALLVQQAASFVDVALDAECGDGPYGWLALQEQRRRGFCCGPQMIHAGCGGVLASSHSLDIAGVELADPLSADVHASSVISLLHSDVKAALKSAFGSSDGPLSVTDWCKVWSQSGDGTATSDGFSSESTLSECRDTSSNIMGSVGDPVSPLQSSASVSSNYKDGIRGDDTSQRRSNRELFTPESESQLGLRYRPRLYVVPYPSVLVGYQDDWLKTSASSLQLWEKAPLEPYALKKNMVYYVVCPNIDPLTSATEDFFQQLGTVYETCKLGTHSPQILGNELGSSSTKLSSSGFVLLDCPQSMKIETSSASLVGSISDYFLSLSNGWDITSFLKSLTKVLKALKLGSLPSSTNAKEGNSTPSTVIYIVCPFPDQTAILQTVVEACVAIGSVVYSADSDRRSMLYSQVGKALSSSAGIDEASASNILRLYGFSIPKLVLQIVTVDTIFRVTSPTLNELIILKEIAFTVYNKARRISQRLSNDLVHSSSLPGRSHSVSIQMANSVPGMWKECVTSRISGPSIPRENEMDTGLQGGGWNSTWQTSRSGGLNCDGNRVSDMFLQEEMRCMFEPLFILSEPGSLEHAFSSSNGNMELDSSKQVADDGGFHQNSNSAEIGGIGSQLEGSESESFGFGHRKSLPSLHCCYGWTEDWRWMVCVWTDSRGELLDSHIFPFGGVSSRQDTKGIQSLFVQVLQQGCQILQAATTPDNGAVRPRDFVITRIGSFFELEYQEWQKALYSIGGSEMKKWPVQLRRVAPDGLSTGGNVQQQEMERSLPNSPSPLYSSHTKSSGYTRGQPSVRLLGGPQVDSSRGLLQWVQSISFVSVSVDHSLHFVLPEETPSGGAQGSSSIGSRTYLEGYTPVKSLGSTPASYIFVPSPTMRFLTPSPFQLPTCLTSESPPLAHLLHSRGTAIPISTGFAVSKSVPSLQKNGPRNCKQEWPSILSVGLVDYYGKGVSKPNNGPRGGGPSSEPVEVGGETSLVLESVAAELHALSWMTVSPAYLDRRTALPFHCDTVLRLRRLLHFADKHLSRDPEKMAG